ncbi:MAG: hypothetical protein KIS92_22215 [Planctomycetota bacterium]|nr:hypothetical protein [Planctomycetota bacterium]
MPTQPDQSALVQALAARRPELEAFEPQWRLVEDVLAGRVKRRGPEASGWTSSYLPKGRMEAPGEYALRVEMTPFFPETPRVLASRLGALLRTRPQFEGISDPEFGAWLNEAGRRHARFDDLIAQAACQAQVYGFCAALLDRDPLPPDAHGREASVAEARARRLGRPYLALYAAPEVLDWQFGSDGRLLWVKFAERERSRARWDAPADEAYVYRIVDREAVRVFRARRDGEGRWSVQAETPIAHGFGRVPVAFCHPFPGADGIGRPLLARAAEADIAATRVLSDLVWDLFVLGNPILTLKTSRPETELERIGLGASRYVPLRAGRPNMENAEELSFVQLDPTGLEMLFRAHALFSKQAQRQAGLGADEAAAIPREQSGVARAWAFSTGEERLLFMLARSLEPFLNDALSLAGEALGTAERPTVRLPESFQAGTE